MTMGELFAMLVNAIARGVPRSIPVYATDDDEINGIHRVFGITFLDREELREFAGASKRYPVHGEADLNLLIGRDI